MTRAHHRNTRQRQRRGVSPYVEHQRRIVNLAQPCGICRIVKSQQLYVGRHSARELLIG